MVRSSRLLDSIGTLARLGLAAVWLISGAIKVADLNGFDIAVKAYQLFPDSVASLLAAVIPFVEVAFGLLLLFGIGVRIIAVLSGLLLLAYIAGVAQSWARGLSIDCGCFGGGGQVSAGQTQYPQEILRDTGFVLLAVWLTVRPRSFASVDGWLTSRQTPDEYDDLDGDIGEGVGEDFDDIGDEFDADGADRLSGDDDHLAEIGSPESRFDGSGKSGNGPAPSAVGRT